MAVYLATGLHAGEAEPEEDEIIHKRMLSFPAVVKMVLKGTIRDAKTISSVLWLDRVWEITAKANPEAQEQLNHPHGFCSGSVAGEIVVVCMQSPRTTHPP